MKYWLLLLLPAFLLPVPGCKQDNAPASNLPTVSMTLGSKTYTLEIAAKEDERNRGLMFRDAMPEDHGMVFIFTDEQSRSFWMKNTRIPLDIIYVGASGKIISIKHMAPYVMKPMPSDGDAKFAIELNDGQAAMAGLKAGDVLQLPDAVRNAKAEP